MIKRLRYAGITEFPMSADNPVLAAGEIGIDTDSGEMKLGDGATAWNDLSAISNGATSSTVDGGTP